MSRLVYPRQKYIQKRERMLFAISTRNTILHKYIYSQTLLTHTSRWIIGSGYGLRRDNFGFDLGEAKSRGPRVVWG